MKSCPKCFRPNAPAATACTHCNLPFDLTAVNLARTCPAGRHVMDPVWTVCAFCKAEGLVTDEASASPGYGGDGASRSAAQGKTQFEGGPVAGGTEIDPWLRGRIVPESASGGEARKTRIDAGPALPLQGAGSGPRKTSFGGAGGLAGAPAITEERRIVGVLITYTWKAEGQIFPLREGRNWIGRDPAQADIVIKEDPTLSGVNSTILFRTRFVIGDKDSMGGTYVNGAPVEESSFPLPNYARIRTGSTMWTFVAMDPATAG